MQLSYREILERAETAAEQENWSLLVQSLQQLLNDGVAIDHRSLFSDPNTATTLLDLALLVLEWGSFQDRWEIAKIFPSFGTDAIAPLLELLSDEDADPETQWFAIRILGSFNHPRVVNALVEVLQTAQSEELSSMAVTVLVSLGATAVSVLETLLYDSSTRLLAIQALGQIRRSETIPLLLQVVNDPDAQARSIAIEALSSFHASEITAVLIAALQDVSVAVRLAAVSGLGFRQAQTSDTDEIVRSLRPLLYDFNLEVCRQTAIALGRLGTSEATIALNDVLRSPHTPEILAIDLVRALGWIATPAALEFLEIALPQLSEPVQLELIQTLGRLDRAKSEAAQILLNALPTIQSATLRQAIALSLGQLGDARAIDLLIQLLADPDEGVRLHVISALKMLDATSVYQQLSRVKESDSPLGTGVTIALREWNR